MALLFIDGFDHMGTSGTLLSTKYNSIGSAAVASGSARTGAAGLRLTSSGGAFVETKTLPASGGAIVGLAWRFTAFSANTDLIEVKETSTLHVALGVTTGGLLTVKRSTTVLATGSTVLAINTWYYLELKCTIHDTTGSYEVRIDGVTELTGSSADTRNGGTGVWNRIVIGTGPSNDNSIDDFYVCDDSGSSPTNTFLGVCKVETLLPQTDATAAGSNAGLTPSTGTDHGALVDENPPNTSDYNSSASVGVKDTYCVPSLALTGTILGIQTNLYAAKSDAGARSVCAVVRSGGTDYDGSNVSPSTTFGYFSEVRALNPNGNVAWTSGAIDSLEAGMKVTV